MAHKHISIETWLTALGMQDYLQLFTRYSGVEDIIYFGESDVRDLGLKNSSHRAKIISSLRILRDKYERGRHKSGVGRSDLHRDDSGISESFSTLDSDLQILNASPEKLQFELQRELKGDPSELKSHGWYHGSVSRQRAEQLLNSEGDYLVRDCISRPGDFVLTCFCKGVPLHFMINSKVTDIGYNSLPKVSYHFEDEVFSTIQELIIYYSSKKKAITKTSSAIIVNPVARRMPLSYYDSKYGTLNSMSPSGSLSTNSSPYTTPSGSPSGSPKIRRNLGKRTGSQPLLSMDDDNDDGRFSPQLDRCDSLPTIQRIESRRLSDNIYQPCGRFPIHHKRSGSEPMLVPKVNPAEIGRSVSPLGRLTSADSDSSLHKQPPPKPSRIPSVKYKKRPLVAVRKPEIFLEEDDGRDYSDYDQVKEKPSWLKNEPSHDFNKNVMHFERKPSVDNNTAVQDIHSSAIHPSLNLIKHPSISPDFKPRTRFPSDTRFSILDSVDYDSIYSPKEPNLNENSLDYDVIPKRNYNVNIPEVQGCMSYNLQNFTSSLLPEENKPLQASTLIAVKTLLFNFDANQLSQHLTKVDIDLLKIVGDHDLGVFVNSGLELITLPQGKQLRQDLVERCYCLKALLMISVLTCHNTAERARMISRWVEIAANLRSVAGNLFAFVLVMEGLTSPQIHRLRDTWFMLRKNHTNSAFIYDTKLKVAFKHLNDGSGPLPLQNVSIPNIVPVVLLLERGMDSAMDLLSCETTDSLAGLDSILAHLDTARLITAQCGLYAVHADSILNTLETNQEVLDIFRTELHLKLLWGSKGANVSRIDRHTKFDRLLTVLSEKAERTGDDGTAV